MTIFETPAWPANMTYSVCNSSPRAGGLVFSPAASIVVESGETSHGDEDATRLARALAAEDFISSITLSNADDPQLEVPTVLLFSGKSWEVSRSTVGIVPAGERDRGSATWHRCSSPPPMAATYVVPNVNRPLNGAISFYRVTRDEERSAYAFHVGTVSRRDDEIVWEDDDDRCHLIRYASGELSCLELDCEQSYGRTAHRS